MCSSSCPTPGAHQTWGECVRAKGVQVGDLKGHVINKRGESDLAAYKRARELGIQPSGIERSAVDRAVRISESTGKPFDAASPIASL